jgi:alkylation response protein AidB-like acyl-CoA dehydrogenase
MTTILVDMRDQLFILKNMLHVENLNQYPKFSEFIEFELVIKEAHRFAKAELYPTNTPADKDGCNFNPKDHTVRLPQCFHKPYYKFCEGGWLAMCDDPKVGGSGYPMSVGTAVNELFYAAGFSIFGAAELSHAGAKVIEKFGTEEQKSLYMTKLFSGQWLGTMCLTEPDAGSDVGEIQTIAKPHFDGSYRLSGTKIFISCGEHDLTENIIHMVLARVEKDPPGTKGLSLFIVPKYLCDNNGQFGARNDVVCMGIENKMGLHGFPTCTMSFGDKGECVAYLLGERGKGIIEMFHMMNEQRLLVGLQGLSYASAAFLHAVDYARNRKQGRSVYPGRKINAHQVFIIEHPDIKRMLLTMKAYVEGQRALAYYTSWCIDYAGVTADREKAKWQGLVELLIPIVKAYLTDNAWAITGMAIQCAGGYGYCSDYPFERLARDCKVTSIYEGTNGIQATDLLFRKIIADKCVNFKELMKQIDQTVESACLSKSLQQYAHLVQSAKEGIEDVVEHLLKQAQTGDFLPLYAKAVPFLEAMGDVILGWLHLWQLTLAYPKVEALGGEKANLEVMNKIEDGAFYYGKVSGAQFFIQTLLGRTKGKFAELKSDAEQVINIFDKAFSG